MNAPLIALVKNFLKSSLDNYILPGTLTGSEILWIYVRQWKRDAASLIIACYFLSAHNLLRRNAGRLLTETDLKEDQGHPV